ncbi:hypothetical protein RRG08_053296 [Elysia crispata]|uniref:Uncharacterized protein n=1 Tax=Elysia crispata TaxID=231223 RepID=A0AAE1DAM4_9GAST|nr:hypothetical protein RRG08_053296 [Elysia crispata]
MTEEGWSKGGEEGGGCSKRIQKTPDELHYVCLQLAEWLALMEGTELLIWASFPSSPPHANTHTLSIQLLRKSISASSSTNSPLAKVIRPQDQA